MNADTNSSTSYINQFMKIPRQAGMFQRFVLLLIFCLSINTSQGQVLISLLFGDKLNSDKIEFGLDGGLNLSTQSGLNQIKPLSSFNLGFYFDFKLKKSWVIHTGVIVKSTMGAADLSVYPTSEAHLDSVMVGGSVDRKLNYFSVPVLLKYNFNNHFFIEAGPQFGLLHKAFDEFTNTVNGDKVTYRNEIRDKFHRMDAGFTGGLGYRLLKGNGMNIGIRYYYGLVDVVIDDTGSAIANRSLYFTVGIPIGAGKVVKE